MDRSVQRERDRLGRRWAIGGLAVATAILLGVGMFEGLLESRYGDGGIIELLAAPVDETKPFGPMIWVAALFALLGPLRPWHRLVARMLCGLALLVALFWISLTSAFADELQLPTDEDALVVIVSLSIALVSGWWGFGKASEPDPTET